MGHAHTSLTDPPFQHSRRLPSNRRCPQHPVIDADQNRRMGLFYRLVSLLLPPNLDEFPSTQVCETFFLFSWIQIPMTFDLSVSAV